MKYFNHCLCVVHLHKQENTCHSADNRTPRRTKKFLRIMTSYVGNHANRGNPQQGRYTHATLDRSRDCGRRVVVMNWIRTRTSHHREPEVIRTCIFCTSSVLRDYLEQYRPKGPVLYVRCRFVCVGPFVQNVVNWILTCVRYVAQVSLKRQH